MKAKNVIFVAIGAVLGYGLYKHYIADKKAKQANVDNLEVEAVIVDANNSFQSQCEQKWGEYAKAIKPSSAEAMATLKKTFIDKCVADSQTSTTQSQSVTT